MLTKLSQDVTLRSRSHLQNEIKQNEMNDDEYCNNKEV